MSYQIEPEEYKSEPKRQSLYHYIRHASKIMKLRTAKHKSDTSTFEDFNEKYPVLEEDISSYYVNEKSCNWPNTNQLAFPPKSPITTPKQIKVDLHFDDEEDDLAYQEHIYTDSSYYSSTMQKLCGVSLTKDSNAQNKTNTAVLISLSPVALAAANAARQRRQKIRNMILA